MPEQTLYFQNPRFVRELFGGDEQLLASVEQTLDLRVTTRDDWIRLEGETPAVGQGETLFQLLASGRRHGLKVGGVDFRNALDAVAEGRADDLRTLYEQPLKLDFGKKTVIAKTLNQRLYLEAMSNDDVVFGVGPAGTGKTFLAVAMALHALLTEKVERIILTRPAVEAGEALGFLPGDLGDKIKPYLLPLFDAVYDLVGQREGDRLLGEDNKERRDVKNDRGPRIEIAPLAYMRGRTLSNAFVILDEAQNTTPEQMMMFLTRLGNGSRMVVTGDKTQVDLPRHKYSGLKEAEEVLGHVQGIHFHTFTGVDVVRNPLVQKIIDAYAAFDERTGAHQPREARKN